MPRANQLLNSCCRSLSKSKCRNAPVYQWEELTAGTGGTLTRNDDGSVTLVALANGFVQVQDTLHSMDPRKDFIVNFRARLAIGTGHGFGFFPGLKNGTPTLQLQDTSNPALSLFWSGAVLGTSNANVATIDNNWHNYEFIRKGNNLVFRQDSNPIVNLAINARFPVTPLFPTFIVGGDLIFPTTGEMSFFCVKQL